MCQAVQTTHRSSTDSVNYEQVALGTWLAFLRGAVMYRGTEAPPRLPGGTRGWRVAIGSRRCWASGARRWSTRRRRPKAGRWRSDRTRASRPERRRGAGARRHGHRSRAARRAAPRAAAAPRRGSHARPGSAPVRPPAQLPRAGREPPPRGGPSDPEPEDQLSRLSTTVSSGRRPRRPASLAGRSRMISIIGASSSSGSSMTTTSRSGFSSST